MAACASTGNLANSVAAHAAARRAWSRCVFIPSDLEQAKIVTTAVFGGELIAVDGTYDDVNRLCAELASERPTWAFVNVNVRPYYAEGSKTLAFEVAEQLGWQAPDHVVVPIASGSQLDQDRTRASRSWPRSASSTTAPTVRDLGRPGRRLLAGRHGVRRGRRRRPAGASPTRSPSRSPSATRPTAATPSDVVRSTGGAFGAVSDDEIVEGIRLLARTEGIFAETAGGVTIATLAKLAASGVVRPDERVVAYVTGNGLKTVEALGDRAADRPPTIDAATPGGVHRPTKPPSNNPRSTTS